MSGINGLDYGTSKLRAYDVLTKPVPKPDNVKIRLNFQLFPHLVSDIKGEYQSTHYLIKRGEKS